MIIENFIYIIDKSPFLGLKIKLVIIEVFVFLGFNYNKL